MSVAMAAELEDKPIPDGNPNEWADRTKSRVQFDYDAYAEVERWWTSGGGRQHIEALARLGAGHYCGCDCDGGRPALDAGTMVKSRL
jgi:hypothetical protein